MAEPASGGMPQEDPAVAEARATTFRKSIAKKVISELAAKKAVRKDEEKRARQFVAKAVQVVKWMDNEDWKTWNAHPMIKKYYAHRGFEGEDAADHYNVYQKVIRAAFVNERSNRTSKIKLAAKRLCGATREAAGDKELTGDDPAIVAELLPNMNRQEANVPAWDFLGKCAAASLPKRARADAIDTLTISDVAWIKTVLSAYVAKESMFKGAAGASYITDEYKLLYKGFCTSERTERDYNGGELLRASRARRAAVPPPRARIEVDMEDVGDDFFNVD